VTLCQYWYESLFGGRLRRRPCGHGVAPGTKILCELSTGFVPGVIAGSLGGDQPLRRSGPRLINGTLPNRARWLHLRLKTELTPELPDQSLGVLGKACCSRTAISFSTSAGGRG
jgi:hypothetical protein